MKESAHRYNGETKKHNREFDKLDQAKGIESVNEQERTD